MTQVIPVTQARRDLLKLVDQVNEDYSRVDLTKKGKVKATLVSPEYLDSLEETIYTLEHSMDDIRRAEKEIAKVESEKAKFIKLIPRAMNEDVVSAYEEEISSLSKKSLVLKNSLMSFDKHRPNIETALDIVFDFLKDPLKQWQKGNIHTQKLVLRLVFEENLRYNRKSGFETAILSLPLRVFTLPEAQKGSLVEMPGIEPGCNRYVSNDSTAVESFEV